MKKEFDSTPGAELSREEFTKVIEALEPDQIISTKKRHYFPRRRLTRMEMIVFWALRIYLVFMVAVVAYQIWTSAR